MGSSGSSTHQTPDGIRRSRRPFWRHLLRTTPVILATILLTVLAGRVLQLDQAAIDLESRWRRPSTDSPIVVVHITDDDYETLFGSTSPLSPSRVGEILDAITVGKPRLIGVDLDTSHHDYATLESDHWPSIVWMQDLIADRGEARPGAVKGLDAAAFRGRPLSTNSATRVDTAGLAIVAPDTDGLIRRYQRCWKTRDGSFPSFVWAISEPQHADVECASQPRPRRHVIEYGRFTRWSFSVGQILEQPHAAREQWLKDRIVLLGGAYAAARDVHATPLGQMFGIDILAAAIETELTGEDNWFSSRLQRLATHAPGWLDNTGLLDGFLLIGLLDGYLLLVFFYRYQPRVALLLSVLATAAIVLVTGLIVPGLSLYVTMVCIAVLAWQLLDVANDYRKQLIRQLVEPPPIPPTPQPSSKTGTPDPAPAGPMLAGLAVIAALIVILGRRSR
jgi:CHASE2 domain-containing sensor protein